MDHIAFSLFLPISGRFCVWLSVCHRLQWSHCVWGAELGTPQTLGTDSIWTVPRLHASEGTHLRTAAFERLPSGGQKPVSTVISCVVPRMPPATMWGLRRVIFATKCYFSHCTYLIASYLTTCGFQLPWPLSHCSTMLKRDKVSLDS